MVLPIRRDQTNRSRVQHVVVCPFSFVGLNELLLVEYRLPTRICYLGINIVVV